MHFAGFVRDDADDARELITVHVRLQGGGHFGTGWRIIVSRQRIGGDDECGRQQYERLGQERMFFHEEQFKPNLCFVDARTITNFRFGARRFCSGFRIFNGCWHVNATISIVVGR